MAGPWMQVHPPSQYAVLSQRWPQWSLAASGRFSRASRCSPSPSLQSPTRPHMSGGTERACLTRATTPRRELVCPTCARLGRNAAFRTASRGRTAPRHPLRTAIRGPSVRANVTAGIILATNHGRHVPRRTSTWISPFRTPIPSAPILFASFQRWPSEQGCRQQMYQQRALKSRRVHHRAMPDPA